MLEVGKSGKSIPGRNTASGIDSEFDPFNGDPVGRGGIDPDRGVVLPDLLFGTLEGPIDGEAGSELDNICFGFDRACAVPGPEGGDVGVLGPRDFVIFGWGKGFGDFGFEPALRRASASNSKSRAKGFDGIWDAIVELGPEAKGLGGASNGLGR